MSITTKTSAREAFIAHVLANGWVEDTTAILTNTVYGRNERGGRTITEVPYQERFAYTRPAVDGGRWRIVLDYKVDAGWGSSRTDNTLRAVAVRLITDDEQPNEHGRISGRHLGKLKPQGRYASTNWLTKVLPGATLRQKAEALVSNPDVAVWVSYSEAWADKLVQEAEAMAHWADREERDKPLKITVTQGEGGYGSANEWQHLIDALNAATRVVARADGKTDLPAAIDALLDAVAAVDAVVAR